jgi:DNA-directed RNA polymerase subunit RPC12/RpoP
MDQEYVYCPECGSKEPAGSRFCGNCGAQIPVPVYPQSVTLEEATV